MGKKEAGAMTVVGGTAGLHGGGVTGGQQTERYSSPACTMSRPGARGPHGEPFWGGRRGPGGAGEVARRWQQCWRRAVAARAHERGGDGRKSSVERFGVNRGGEAPFIGLGEGL
jgi:hypothetical protein